MRITQTLLFLAGTLALSACGNQVTNSETAWCDEQLDSERMARALRGHGPQALQDEAKTHCVLVAAGVPIDIVDDIENDFGQIYLQGDLVRPDTGKTARLWAREDLAGLE